MSESAGSEAVSRCAPFACESMHWPISSAALAEAWTPSVPNNARAVVSVLAAADELATCGDMDSMLRRAVELARECIELERVGLYLRDPSTLTMRGTFGTGSHGETVDERDFSHQCNQADYEALLRTGMTGARWLHVESTSLFVKRGGRMVPCARGWLAITPLVHAGDLVGVMYNDAANTLSPVDDGKQIRAAIFCSLLAGIVVSKRRSFRFRASALEARPSLAVDQTLRLLQQDPLVDSENLARNVALSAGHLARLFKSQTGMSIVEYRNRIRIERFFGLVESSGKNLLDAAMEAGFGSYAQFHRVFRRLLGAAPREYLSGRRSLPSPALPLQRSAASGLRD